MAVGPNGNPVWAERLSAMLRVDGHFNPSDRRREKEASRARDEYLIVSGVANASDVAQHNGFFAALDASRARIVQRHVNVSLRDVQIAAA